MNLDTVRHFKNIEPFDPFEIRLANGDRHQIVDPDNVAIGRNVVMIAYSDSDRLAWCTPHQIVSIGKITSPKRRGNGRKSKN